MMDSFVSPALAAGASGLLSSPVPMSDYTIAVMEYGLMIGFLLTVLFAGAFLILNLGLMSRRDRDQIGHRDPSDLALLRNTNWPQEPENPSVLPAKEEEEEEGGERPAA